MNSSLKVLLQLSAIFALSAQILSVSAFTTVSKSTSTLLKREIHHTIQPRQEGGKAGAGAKSPAVEEAAGQLVGMITQIGEALDAVTNMGSTAAAVKQGSETVTKIMPDAQKARVTVMNSVTRTEKLNSQMKQSDVAGEQILQLLKAISENPEDANAIKKSFPALAKSFGEVFIAAEGAVTAAFPDKGAKFAEVKKLKVQPDASEKKKSTK